MRHFFGPMAYRLPLALALMLLFSSCAMLLRPTTAFDRRRIARSYGEIVTQSNPNCENCTDRFLIRKEDGCLITLVVKYDGRVEVYE